MVFEGWTEAWTAKLLAHTGNFQCQILWGRIQPKYFSFLHSPSLPNLFLANSFEISFSRLTPQSCPFVVMKLQTTSRQSRLWEVPERHIMNCKAPRSNLKWWISFPNIFFKIAHGLQPVTRQRCGGCIQLPVCFSHCSSLIYNSR